MVTSGTFSTSAAVPSPVPYLTGAFAGTGGFKVSPILGYQTGGLNPDGTPNTTSRQFQAGLSVTGKGTAQNATLFVMTSQISNAPNIGFTHAGGFTAATVRNGAGWYGLAGGSVSSATPTSAPNTVSTVNGTPIAGFTLNNTNTNLITGTVTNSQSSNFVQPASANYTFNPDKYGNADIFGKQPSEPGPERLCRGSHADGAWRCAGRADESHEALCHHQSQRDAGRRRHLSARQFKRDARSVQCEERRCAHGRDGELRLMSSEAWMRTVASG